MADPFEQDPAMLRCFQEMEQSMRTHLSSNILAKVGEACETIGPEILERLEGIKEDTFRTLCARISREIPRPTGAVLLRQSAINLRNFDRLPMIASTIGAGGFLVLGMCCYYCYNGGIGDQQVPATEKLDNPRYSPRIENARGADPLSLGDAKNLRCRPIDDRESNQEVNFVPDNAAEDNTHGSSTKKELASVSSISRLRKTSTEMSNIANIASTENDAHATPRPEQSEFIISNLGPVTLANEKEDSTLDNENGQDRRLDRFQASSLVSQSAPPLVLPHLPPAPTGEQVKPAREKASKGGKIQKKPGRPAKRKRTTRKTKEESEDEGRRGKRAKTGLRKSVDQEAAGIGDLVNEIEDVGRSADELKNDTKAGDARSRDVKGKSSARRQ